MKHAGHDLSSMLDPARAHLGNQVPSKTDVEPKIASIAALIPSHVELDKVATAYRIRFQILRIRRRKTVCFLYVCFSFRFLSEGDLKFAHSPLAISYALLAIGDSLHYTLHRLGL